MGNISFNFFILALVGLLAHLILLSVEINNTLNRSTAIQNTSHATRFEEAPVAHQPIERPKPPSDIIGPTGWCTAINGAWVSGGVYRTSDTFTLIVPKSSYGHLKFVGDEVWHGHFSVDGKVFDQAGKEIGNFGMMEGAMPGMPNQRKRYSQDFNGTVRLDNGERFGLRVVFP